MAVLILCLVTGCTWTRTVYVPPGEPVRIREEIPGAKVWVMGADGKPVAGEIDIPEGWYAVPPPDNGTDASYDASSTMER